MPHRAISIGTLLVVLSGCAANNQQYVGATMGIGGGGAAMVGIGIAIDGHPKGHPEIVTRAGNPSVGVPVAMAGAVVSLVGLIVYLTAKRSPPPSLACSSRNRAAC